MGLGVVVQIQSRRKYTDGLDDLDPYFTCAEAVDSLIALEGNRLPQKLWEPAAGDGAIVRQLLKTERTVLASDIHDYGLAECRIVDYFAMPPPPPGWIDGIVTNPPFKAALAFAQKAVSEVPYVALLVRSNFATEGTRRDQFFEEYPPTRTWLSSHRLPTMHRYGWEGKRAPSNTPFCWLVWERDAEREFPQRFNWREVLGLELSDRSKQGARMATQIMKAPGLVGRR
jgi:hypothetical protein